MAKAKSLAMNLESTLDSVDVAEEAVTRFAEGFGLPEDDVHQIGMAVRESVVNAVVHGNRYNSEKAVVVKAEAAGAQIIITVEDQGEGFEQQEVPDPLAPENLMRKSGRGLFLIRAFMDELRLVRLGSAGMQVVMIKNCSPNTQKEDL